MTEKFFYKHRNQTRNVIMLPDIDVAYILGPFQYNGRLPDNWPDKVQLALNRAADCHPLSGGNDDGHVNIKEAVAFIDTFDARWEGVHPANDGKLGLFEQYTALQKYRELSDNSEYIDCLYPNMDAIGATTGAMDSIDLAMAKLERDWKTAENQPKKLNTSTTPATEPLQDKLYSTFVDARRTSMVNTLLETRAGLEATFLDQLSDLTAHRKDVHRTILHTYQEAIDQLAPVLEPYYKAQRELDRINPKLPEPKRTEGFKQ